MGFKFGQQRVADSAAQQNFEQLEGELDDLAAGPTIVFGRVGSTATILAAGSGNWSVSSLGTGLYAVTFDVEFAEPPAVTVTTEDGRGGAAALNGPPLVNSVQVSTYDSQSEGNIAQNFSFHAVGFLA